MRPAFARFRPMSAACSRFESRRLSDSVSHDASAERICDRRPHRPDHGQQHVASLDCGLDPIEPESTPELNRGAAVVYGYAEVRGRAGDSVTSLTRWAWPSRTTNTDTGDLRTSF
jgi:hypothetical protein